MRHFIFTFLLIFNFSNTAAYAATATKKVCVNSKGAIVVKSKCKKGEKLLSAVTLNQEISTSQEASGPVGPQGAPGVLGEVGQQGPAGPQGLQGVPGVKGSVGQLDLSSCYLTAEAYRTNFSNSSNPILYAEVFCNNPNTEFLLEEESRVSFFPESAGTKVALQGRSTYTNTINGDKREYGVGIFANRFFSAGSGIFAGVFEFTVRGVCCPR